jgi:hypothetical protein
LSSEIAERVSIFLAIDFFLSSFLDSLVPKKSGLFLFYQEKRKERNNLQTLILLTHTSYYYRSNLRQQRTFDYLQKNGTNSQNGLLVVKNPIARINIKIEVPIILSSIKKLPSLLSLNLIASINKTNIISNKKTPITLFIYFLY